ncbi:MAG: DUF945 family protein [Pseudomonadota bacterium]
MKKGVVFLLVALALIVLVSPGLIGRLAERSVDEGIRTGSVENDDMIVSAEIFSRGWFTTEGQHRIEFKDGSLADEYRSLFELEADAPLPVLIVNTRIDHGLIPLASLGRDDGSLMPGLGDAVSTITLEMPDGETLSLPGAINSSIGLSGAVFSEYALEAGEYAAGGIGLRWGEGNVVVEMHPSDGRVLFDVAAESFAVDDGTAPFTTGPVEVSGEQRPSGYGYSLGKANVLIDSIAVNDRLIGPFAIRGGASLDDDRIVLDTSMDLALPVAGLGDSRTLIDIEARGIEPRAFGALMRKYQQAAEHTEQPELVRSMLEPEAQALLAHGLTVDIPRFDVELPDGTLQSTLGIEIEATDVATFAWSDLLLDTTANASVRVPETLMDMVLEMNPQVGVAIGMGYLKKDGDVYVSDAEYAKGLLNINGAPMPIPLPGR